MFLDKKLLSETKIFWFSFVVTIIFYLLFLSNSGFGWDGDSIISASQFVKLFNPQMHGVYDNGTVPKVFTILTFGFAYQLTDGFVFLTFVSIILNALMVACICKWIYLNNGFWIVSLVGILICTLWTFIVITCDNPAFSIPFLFFGLYYYFEKRKVLPGLIFLVISNFFRPGSEYVIGFIIIIEILKRTDRKVVLLGLLALLIALIHTTYGYTLAYSSKQEFLNKCVLYKEQMPEWIKVYKHSLQAFTPFINSILIQIKSPVIFPFTILFINGLYRIIVEKKSISNLSLIFFATLILPAGAFVYGNIAQIHQAKHMEISLMIIALAAMNPLWNIKLFENRESYKFRNIILAGFYLMITTLLFHYNSKVAATYNTSFEIKTEGRGIIKWRNILQEKKIVESNFDKKTRYNSLISYGDITFYTLDLGMRTKDLYFLEDNKQNLDSCNLILLPKDYDPDVVNSFKNDSINFNLFTFEDGHLLFLRKASSL